MEIKSVSRTTARHIINISLLPCGRMKHSSGLNIWISDTNINVCNWDNPEH
jgi:hypothetical protein